MAKKMKLLLAITSDIYVRNYIESGVVDKLAEIYDLHIAVRSSLLLCDRVRARFKGVSQYTLTTRRQRQGRLIFDVMMLRYAKKSTSFVFRARTIPAPMWTSLRARRPPLAVGREVAQMALARVLSVDPAFRVFKRHFVDRLPANQPLLNLLDDVRPDLIMVPSSGYAMEAIDLAKLCRARGIKTLLLIDNWDNLSSKSVLWELPDHVGVWGEQSKEHAVNIQGFKPDQVSLLGTPRFDEYLSARARDIPSHFPYPYALFVGTAFPLDEAGALRELDEEIDQHPDIYGGLKIVYRPHPWRLGKDYIGDMNLKHVVVDPQMADNYARRKLTKSFQPTLDYYPSLLKNAVFALGGISSMLIESVVFAKRYVVIVYDEKGNLYSPKQVFEEHVHFRGLERVPGLCFCHERSNLPALFRKVFNEAKTPLPYADVDREREYFLRIDKRPYSERLQELVGKLLAGGLGTEETATNTHD